VAVARVVVEACQSPFCLDPRWHRGGTGRCRMAGPLGGWVGNPGGARPGLRSPGVACRV